MRDLIFGFFDPSITLGHILQAAIVAGAAVWVGKKISRRHLDERSVRDLLSRSCGEALEALRVLSDAVESGAELATGKLLDGSERGKLFRKFQIYSNHVLILSMALKESCSEQRSLKLVLTSVGPLKDAADDLQDRICEPLVRDVSFAPQEIRGVHGSILKNRELLVQMQLRILLPPSS